MHVLQKINFHNIFPNTAQIRESIFSKGELDVILEHSRITIEARKEDEEEKEFRRTWRPVKKKNHATIYPGSLD